jgi:diguanylate cyclase (GGDEF)-like protein
VAIEVDLFGVVAILVRDEPIALIAPDPSATIAVGLSLADGRGADQAWRSLRDLQLRHRQLAAGVDALEHQARYDALTGLPNRALLNDRLQALLAEAQEGAAPVGLLLLDLDRFKDINDTLGHHFGDLLLQGASVRLAAALRPEDTLARLGGDEFAVLLPGAGQAEAVAAARSLLQALHEPIAIHGHELSADVSIGIAVAPEHGDDPATLLRRADIAMYLAKQARKGCAVYAPGHDRHSVEGLRLSLDLRRAIVDGELILHYQPKLDLAADRVRAVEALVRWQHPTLGLVPPDRFIGLAEQTGLIRDLTSWVLRNAVAQCAAWRADGLDVGVAINLSARCLLDEGLPQEVAAVLAEHRVPPACLVLEVTESALMADPEQAMRVTRALRDAGTAIAIDDFGTGHSSLAYLSQLPAEQLKIDRSFVLAMMGSERDAVIVRSAISLAHDLGLRVVAEGVEDAATLAQLARLGCDEAQGYHLTPPLPPCELAAWLTGSPRGDAGAAAA